MFINCNMFITIMHKITGLQRYLSHLCHQTKPLQTKLLPTWLVVNLHARQEPNVWHRGCTHLFERHFLVRPDQTRC